MSNIIISPESGILEFNNNSPSGAAIGSATAPIRLDATGGNSFITGSNFGIGTSEPQFTLDVDGSIHGTSGNFQTAITVGGNPVMTGASPEADTLQTVTNRGATTTNSVGIGTTSANGLLQVGKYTVASQGNQGTYGNLSSFANSDTDNIFLGLKNGSYPNRGFAFRTVAVGVNSDFTIYEHGQGSAEVFRITAGGNVGIGTTSPSKKLTVTTSTTSDGVFLETSQPVTYAKLFNSNSESFPVGNLNLGYGSNSTAIIQALSNRMALKGGYTTGGQISFLSASSEIMRMTSTGLGIGTTSPSSKLEVAEATANTAATITVDSASWDAMLSLKNANGTWSILNDYTGAGTTGALAFWNGSYRMVIDNTGRVGIGTTAPNRRLNVIGQFAIDNSTSPSGGLLVSPDGNSNKVYSRTGNANTTAHPLDFISGSSTSMRIAANGNVGIGTTSPAEKLTVIGDILIDNGGNSTLYLGKGAEGVDGVTKIKAIQTGTDTDQLGIAFNVHPNTAGSAVSEEAMRIDHAGNVGIGTTSPSNVLHIAASAPRIRLEDTLDTSNYSVIAADNGQIILSADEGNNQGNSAQIFKIDNSEKMRIDSSGNVGVATTDPAYKLDVNGAARSTHFIDGSKGTGTTPATAGWYKIASWSTGGKRGGTEIKLSTTGGTLTPITWIIRCYKNWSTDATLKLEQYGYANVYLTKARIVQDTSTNILHLEVYQGVSTALTFNMYQTSLMGYDSFVTMATGTLAAGTTGGTVRTELPFVASGTSLEDLYVNDNVSIGTTATSRLTVKSNSVSSADSGFTLQANANTNPLVKIGERSNNKARLHMYASGVEKIAFYTDGTANHISAGNVGIGTTSPNSLLHIEGNNNNDANDYSQLYIKGTGSYPLDIAGIVLDSAGSNQSHLRFSNNGSPKFQIRYNEGNTTADKLNFYSFSQSSDIVTFDGSTGNVGIGTTSPATKLHVVGRARFDDTQINAKGVFADYFSSGQSLTLNSGASANILFKIGNTTALTLDSSQNATFAGDLTVSGGDITLSGTGRIQGIDTVSSGTDATSKTYVDNAITSGVGSYLPLAGGTVTGTLNVNGSSSVLLRVRGGARIALENASATDSFYLSNTGGSGASILDLGGTVSIIEGGNVGIGTTSPQASLHVAGSMGTTPTGNGVLMGLYTSGSTNYGNIQLNGDTGSFIDFSSSGTDWKGRILYNNSSNYMRFDTGGTERVRINSSGYVGIGTTNPAAKLDVKGGMSAFETTLTNNNDWENSAISILERDNVGSAQSADKYSPNLNFHWSGRVSNSLWMNSSGHLNWGSFGSNGIPNADGVLQTNTINLIGTGRITGVDTVTDSTDAANKAYVDAQVGASDTLQEVTDNGNTTTNSVGIGTTSVAGAKLEIQTTAGSAMLQLRPTAASTDINPLILYRGQNNGTANYLLAKNASTYFGVYNSGVPTDESEMVKITPSTSDAPILQIGDVGSTAARLDVGGNIRLLNNGDSYISGGDVGIGTTSPSNALEISNASFADQLRVLRPQNTEGGIAGIINIAGINSASVVKDYARIGVIIDDNTNATEDGSLVLQTITNGTNTEKVRINSLGNVGIGTTNPDQKLEVNGNAHLSYSLIGRGIRSSNRGELHLNSTGINDVSEMFFGYGDGYTEGNIRWAISDRGVATGQIHMYRGPAFGGFATAQTWDDDLNSYFYGNVGIGTTNPSTRLHISIPNSNSQLTLERTGSATGKYQIYTNTNNLYINNVASNTFPLTILNNGNVGIGTASPAFALDVAGNAARIGDSSQTTTSLYLTATNTAGAPAIAVRTIMQGYEGRGMGTFYTDSSYSGEEWFNGINYSGGFHRWSVGYDQSGGQAEYLANAKFTVFHNGNVGIGTHVPFTNLEVAGSGLDSIIRLYAGGGTANIRTWEMRAVGVAGEGLLFRQVNDANNSYTNRMIIDTNGDVGIGTINPAARLDVKAGHIRLDAGYSLQWDNSHERIEQSDGHLEFFVNNTEGMTLDTNGLGIGTTSPQGRLNIKASTSNGSTAFLLQNSSGNNNTVIYDNGTIVAAGAGRFLGGGYFTGGNVGIGTTSPAQKLHVNGNVDIDNGGILFQQGYGLNLGATGYDLYMPTTTRVAINTAATERLSILNNGNVGIGTTNPSDQDLSINTPKLHVVGPSTTGAFNLVARFQGGNDSDNTGAAILINHSNDRGLLINAGRGDSDREVAYFNLVSSGANITNMLTLKKVGSAYNVGVGTTNPTTKLHIDDDASLGTGLTVLGGGGGGPLATFTRDVGSTGTVAINASSGMPQIRFATNNTFAIGVNNTTFEIADNSSIGTNARLSITNTGNVGIGTTNPAYKLAVAGTTESNAFRTPTGNIVITGQEIYANYDYNGNDGSIRLNRFGYQGGQTKFRDVVIYNGKGGQVLSVDGSSSNVGIGTASPSAKLDVAGSIKVGNAGTSRFTDTGAFPLQLNRGLAVDSVGAAGVILGLGAYSTGTTYVDAVRVVGVLEANGTDGDLQLQVLNSGSYVSALTLNNDNNATFAGNVNINSVFDFNTSTDLLTITNNQNTGGIKLSGGNSRIYFGAYRAIEGDQSGGTLYIGEGYGAISLMDDVTVSGNITASGSSYISAAYDGSNYMRMEGNSSGGVLKGLDGGVNTTLIRSYGDSFLNGGKVGIGTTSPRGKLDIVGNTDDDTDFLTIQDNDPSAGSHRPSIRFRSDTAQIGQIASLDNGMRFSVGTTEDSLLEIKSGGNVGINHSSPDYLLDIYGGDAANKPLIKLGGAQGLNEYVGILFGYSNSTTYNKGAIFYINKDSGYARGELHFCLDDAADDGSAGTGDSKMMINYAGNVGIGTTSPSTKLQVAGTSQFDGNLNVANSTLSITAAAPNMLFVVPSGGLDSRIFNDGSGNFIIGHGTNSNSPTERLRINSSGDVGIGINSPAARLHVSEAGTANTQTIVACLSSTSLRPVLQFSENTNATINAGMSIEYDGRGTGTTNKMHINGVDGAAKFTVTSGGNVGIGTTSPDASTLLHVQGVIGTINGSAAAPPHSFYGDPDNGMFRAAVNTLGFSTAGTERLRIDSAGKVIVGTATVAAANAAADNIVIKGEGTAVGLTISNSSNAGTGTIFFGDAASSTAAGFRYNHNTGDMAISAEDNVNFNCDNVGIGTTSPTADLHINSSNNIGLTLEHASRPTISLTDGTNTGFIGLDNGGAIITGTSDNDLAIRSPRNIVFGGNSIARMSITNAGNVGIGTLAPSQKLTVAGSIDTITAMGVAGQWASSQIRLETTNTVDTTGWQGISFDTSTANNYGWSIGANRSSSGRGSFRIYEHINNATGAERFTIKQDGNVGIAVASPANKLDVAGGIAIGASYVGNVAPSNGAIIQGNVGIGVTSPSYALQVGGSIVGSSKSFLIKHPTKEGKQLLHACIEGPENGVYYRGKSTSSILEMPDYWIGLVHIDSMTVDITAIGPNQDLYVESIADDGEVTIGSNTEEPLNYFYVIYGERKDIDKLEIEILAPEYAN